MRNGKCRVQVKAISCNFIVMRYVLCKLYECCLWDLHVKFCNERPAFRA